jgi:hypothetical protein
MEWPYQFVELTEAQKSERRILLDRYGLYVQLSTLLPIGHAGFKFSTYSCGSKDSISRHIIDGRRIIRRGCRA